MTKLGLEVQYEIRHFSWLDVYSKSKKSTTKYKAKAY